MKRAAIRNLRDALQTAAETLTEALGSAPPEYLRLSTSLVDGAPKTLAELPLWIEQLTEEQFQTAWVAVIVAAFIDGDADARGLAAALVAVRTRYAMRHPAEESVPRVMKPRRKKPGLEQWLERVRDALPKIGDKQELRLMLPEVSFVDRREVADALERSGEFSSYRGRSPGMRGGGALILERTGFVGLSEGATHGEEATQGSGEDGGTGGGEGGGGGAGLEPAASGTPLEVQRGPGGDHQ
jgi:uncharacterized membrane protein YgcG